MIGLIVFHCNLKLADLNPSEAKHNEQKRIRKWSQSVNWSVEKNRTDQFRTCSQSMAQVSQARVHISWGDSSPTTTFKAAAPSLLQFGSYAQKKWPLQEPITTELANFKRVLASCRFHRSVKISLFFGFISWHELRKSSTSKNQLVKLTELQILPC